MAYSTAFASSSQLPVTASDLVYEQAAIIFDLAAIHSQLGHKYRSSESNHDGLKHAVNEYGVRDLSATDTFN